MVHLEPELITLLDATARRRGVSRSQLIREAIASHLEPERSTRIAERYRQAYAARPADAVDEWGDVEAWHSELARLRDPDRGESGPWE